MEYSPLPSTPMKAKRSVHSALNSATPNKRDVEIMSTKKQRQNEIDWMNSPVFSPTSSRTLSKSPQRTSVSFSSDRFIAQRKDIDFDFCNHILHKIESPTENCNKSLMSNRYNQCVSETLSTPNRRLLPLFESKQNCTSELPTFIHASSRIDSPVHTSPKRNITRSLPSVATRILDAPDIVDDYYLNLLHWSSGNTIAIALKNSVYLWNATDSSINHLLAMEGESDYIGSVKWCDKNSSILAVGTSQNTVQLWDASRQTMIREMSGHSSRVSSLSWNSDILSSGGRDSVILNHDYRLRNAIVSRYCGHKQEVCGLSWSPDGSTLASGGNENLLCLWDAKMSSTHGPLQQISDYVPRVEINDHKAAVKALSWCPWLRNTLASGGGTADRTIRIWNTSQGNCTKVVDTGSQVCAIEWNECHRELLSSHGFSDNQLILWNYPSMTKIREFRGHESRVLHMAQSPHDGTICSASADETLRFWNIFDGAKSMAKMLSPSRGCLGSGKTISVGLSLSACGFSRTLLTEKVHALSRSFNQME